MSDLDALAVFFEEAFDQCNTLESLLLTLLEQPEQKTDELNAMFRSAHTIKGSAGLFALDSLISFAHVMENVLDRLRHQEIIADQALVDVLLQSNDHLRNILSHYQAQPETPFPENLTQQVLLGQLGKYFQGSDSAIAVTPPSPPPAATSAGIWHLFLHYHTDLFRHGFDPASFLRYLQKLGEIICIDSRFSLPSSLHDFDPTSCYLSNEIAFASTAPAEKIAGVFEFISDESRIDLLPPGSDREQFVALAQCYPGKPEQHLARWEQLGFLPPQSNTPLPPPCAVIEEKAAPPASSNSTASERKKNDSSRFIRVEAAKLDALINRVGELVISAASSRMRAKETGNSEMVQAVEVLSQLVEGIRDDALTLRMVPISEIFNRFPRMVHDVSQRLGKEIELNLEGADTEIDKSMVEKLTDPLMHIVRNAIDHGIEDAATRSASGKPTRGRLTLKAYHDTGAIVVDIIDDGRGMDKTKILAKAQEKGLISDTRALSDQEVYALIFLPGFSTADQISDISGRGVGMDVVRRNIEALRGDTEILTTPGQGTTLRIRLPLTLAIIDGFHVEVDDASLVLPLDMMSECMEMPSEKVSTETRQICLRDEWIPYVSLRELFGFPPSTGTEYVVIAQTGQMTAGIIVDRLVGDIQAVIKPLGHLFRSLRGISGSTIMGNGRLALILDIPQLIQLANKRERRLVHQRHLGLTQGGIPPESIATRTPSN